MTKRRRPRSAHTGPWDDPTMKRWAHEVIEGMVPKLVDSALVMSIVPTSSTGDVKFWVELGASIMMDKPIIAVLAGDTELPEKLARVADEVVRMPEGSPDAESSAELAAAIMRVKTRLEAGRADDE